jgi:CubicO group peptidase (beta-lactamase class C family)
VGSISKTFTATLVLALRDAGTLDLDEPIGVHLPKLAVGEMTPRRLLSHTSGLAAEPVGPWWERNPGVDIETLISAITPEALVHKPGRVYHYSNLGYGLLGALVETLGGQSWANAVESRICVPLGMSRTTYAPAEPYLRGVVVHPHADRVREEPREDSRAMAPAGQIWSTVADLVRWGAFIADPAGVAGAPVTADTMEEMCTPAVLSDLDSWTSAHSLGFQMWRDGQRVFLGHTGSMPGYLAVLMVHRASRTVAVAFVDSYRMGRLSLVTLGRELLTAVLDDEPLDEPAWTAAEPPANVAALLGPWFWMGGGYELVWDGGLAMFSAGRTGSALWRFEPSGPDRWRCTSGGNNGETLQVLRDDAGQPLELEIATYVFSRDPWPAVVR